MQVLDLQVDLLIEVDMVSFSLKAKFHSASFRDSYKRQFDMVDIVCHPFQYVCHNLNEQETLWRSHVA